MTVDEEALDIDAEGTKCKICKRQVKHGAKMVHGRGNRETLRCDGLCRVRRLRGKYGDTAGLKAKPGLRVNEAPRVKREKREKREFKVKKV